MCTIFCTWLNTSYRNTVYRNTPLIGTHLAGPVSYVLYAENTFYRNIIATVTENKRTKAKPPLDNHSPSFFPTVLSLSLAVVFPYSAIPLPRRCFPPQYTSSVSYWVFFVSENFWNSSILPSTDMPPLLSKPTSKRQPYSNSKRIEVLLWLNIINVKLH
jgi:hypothetical protein